MSEWMTVTSHPEARRVAAMIAGVAEIFGEPMSPERIEGYVALLADVPFNELRQGVQRAARTATYFPKPAEIRRHVDLALAARAAEAALTTRDEYDPRTLVHCSACQDTGWVFTTESRDVARGKANTVRRCVCHRSNPKLVSPKSYGADA